MPNDAAQSILGPIQADNSVKADAWQAFKDSANEREYGVRLKGMNLPDNVKADLWEAKRKAGVTSNIPGAPNGLPGIPKPIPQGLQGPQAFQPPQPGGAFPTMGQFGNVQQTPNAAATLGTGIAVGGGGAQFMAAPAATIGGLAGSTAGAKYGGSVGKYIGGRFGIPEVGETVGNVIGGAAGGITGGAAAAEVGGFRNLARQMLAKKLGTLPVSVESAPAESELNDIISRTRRLVKPGEMPSEADIKRAGDLTQAPLSKLKALAKFGDKLAQNELNRRLK